MLWKGWLRLGNCGLLPQGYCDTSTDLSRPVCVLVEIHQVQFTSLFVIHGRPISLHSLA